MKNSSYSANIFLIYYVYIRRLVTICRTFLSDYGLVKDHIDELSSVLLIFDVSCYVTKTSKVGFVLRLGEATETFEC